jgi:hypothetical protein
MIFFGVVPERIWSCDTEFIHILQRWGKDGIQLVSNLKIAKTSIQKRLPEVRKLIILCLFLLNI